MTKSDFLDVEIAINLFLISLNLGLIVLQETNLKKVRELMRVLIKKTAEVDENIAKSERIIEMRMEKIVKILDNDILK